MLGGNYRAGNLWRRKVELVLWSVGFSCELSQKLGMKKIKGKKGSSLCSHYYAIWIGLCIEPNYHEKKKS